MQPDRNPSEWQQPHETTAQEPPANSGLTTPQAQPVVTLTPDEIPPANIQPIASQPTAPMTAQEPQQSTDTEMEPIRWQAHEYIHHEKNVSWFILFSVVVIGLMAVAIFWMQSISFAILVPVMAAALLVYSHRPPRLLDYTLSRQGLHVNDKLYTFPEFKSFGVIHDGQEYSVMLIPTKRFRAGVSVYFPEEAGEAIVDMLGARLPMQELHLDLIDKIIRKLRL
jgi:hypothetical protein